MRSSAPARPDPAVTCTHDTPVALVTGASRGIGRAVALALAARGVRCVVTARTVGGLEQTDDLMAAQTGHRATLLPLNLQDGASVDRLGPSLAERFGRLDILVHCATTFATPTPVAHILDKDWDRMLAVNLTAVLRLLRTTTPLLRQAPAGRTVFPLNGDMNRPAAFHATAAACQAGMEALVRSWRQEMADCPGFAAHLFDPGPTATRLRAQAFPAEENAGLARPEDVAARLLPFCLAETGNAAAVGPG